MTIQITGLACESGWFPVHFGDGEVAHDAGWRPRLNDNLRIAKVFLEMNFDHTLPVLLFSMVLMSAGCVPADRRNHMQSSATEDQHHDMDFEANPISTGEMTQEQKILLVQANAIQLARRGDSENADRVISDAISKYPQDASLLLVRAVLRRKSGRLEEALVDLDQVIAAQPANVDAWCQRAFVHQQLARDDWAEQTLVCVSKAIELGYEGSLVHILAGNAELELGRCEQALTHFNAAVRWSPNSANGHAGRARVWAALGKADLARKDLNRAYSLDLAEEDRAALDLLKAQLEMQQPQE